MILSSRGLKTRAGRSAPASPSGRARGVKFFFGCSNRGEALAQPSFFGGRLARSMPWAVAVSAARTRLGLRDGSDKAEPDLPVTTGMPPRRPGTGAGVWTTLPSGRFSGRIYWPSISRITRGPTSSTAPVGRVPSWNGP